MVHVIVTNFCVFCDGCDSQIYEACLDLIEFRVTELVDSDFGAGFKLYL